MSKEKILLMAKFKPKGDWMLYFEMKNSLTENLHISEYQEFSIKLAKILQIY